jgi:hypothetical protein
LNSIFLLLNMLLAANLVFAQAEVTLSIPTTLTGAAGDTIDVPIFLHKREKPVGALGAAIKVKDSLLSYIDFTVGPIVPGVLLNVHSPQADSVRLAFSDFGRGAITQEGLLATLRFRIDSAAVAGAMDSLLFRELSAADSNATDLKIIGLHGKVTMDVSTLVEGARAANLPVQYALLQNYPNPFRSGAASRFAGNPETVIPFQLPEAGNVELRIYNMLGQEVRMLIDGRMSAGLHQVAWPGNDETGRRLESGAYFIRLRAGGVTLTRKIMLLR